MQDTLTETLAAQKAEREAAQAKAWGHNFPNALQSGSTFTASYTCRPAFPTKDLPWTLVEDALNRLNLSQRVRLPCKLR